MQMSSFFSFFFRQLHQTTNNITVTSRGHNGVSNHRQLNSTDCSTDCSVKPQRTHQTPFLSGIQRWLVNSHHKWSIMSKAFPCHDFIIRESPLANLDRIVSVPQRNQGRADGRVTQGARQGNSQHKTLNMHAFFSYVSRAGSRFAPSQWETPLLCNDVSHWLDGSLESALST